MYFSFFGGSALLHLLAAHPKAVAAVGITTMIAYLSTPLGPRHYFGAADDLHELERSPAVTLLVQDQVIEDAANTAEQASPDDPAARQAVRRVLQACGAGCADLTPAAVLRDRSLLKKAIYVAELDRNAGEVAARRPALAGQVSSR